MNRRDIIVVSMYVAKIYVTSIPNKMKCLKKKKIIKLSKIRHHLYNIWNHMNYIIYNCMFDSLVHHFENINNAIKIILCVTI